MLTVFSVSSQNVFGKWKTIDDETGDEKSIVEIYEHNGKIYGKIIEILNGMAGDLLKPILIEKPGQKWADTVPLLIRISFLISYRRIMGIKQMSTGSL